jgi:hypothetical protein
MYADELKVDSDATLEPGVDRYRCAVTFNPFNTEDAYMRPERFL